MNIKDALLQEHTKKQVEFIGKHVLKSEAAFKNLVEIYFGTDPKLAQRAAWVLSYSVSENPEIIFPYLRKLISHLHRSDLHDAVIRNGTKILETITLPEKHIGAAVDLCFKMVSDPSTAIAAKCYTLTTLSNITKKEPGLKHELKLVIESQLPFATAAFLSRAKRIIKMLNKMKE